ncbi:hypothetical protein CPT_Muldoon_105 [Serratia phage Muldoon]|uniref:Uncharacterized protein n=1 Tax=Serratia phage Muldoon TaxID=2601678 RepID=A0A5P8PJ31_9CAUD|nr:hypothetical protein HYP94_gp104 [Serratia phage Muldoon]QFR56060.1 hypothetical protein CPT_Muldoon_105 [Serratia phage Muldoon]WDS61650.1 hypothetical protein [Cronobacter phage vB_Cdu_VP8]
MKNYGTGLIIIGCFMILVSQVSLKFVEKEPVSDELRICIIKANETQKNYVFKDGKCFVEAE